MSHVRQGSRVPVGPSVEQDPLHPGEVHEPQVSFPAEGGDRVPLVVVQKVPGRHPRVRDEDRPSAVGDDRPKSVRIQPPFAIFGLEGDQAGNRADDATRLIIPA